MVADYEGEGEDLTLVGIRELISDMADQVEKGVSVPEYVSTTQLLSSREIATDVGDELLVYCLDATTMCNNRVNRDLPVSERRNVG